MGTTAKWGLRWPAGTDTPAGHQQIQNLAEDAEALALPLVNTLALIPSAAAAKSGRTYYAIDTNQYFVSNGTAWIEIPIGAGVGAQSGDVKATARPTAPTGWLLCDGASLLRADFAALFAAISTTYGAADGTHFNVPDMRGRVPVGVDGAAGRLDALDALGNAGGAQKYTLQAAESGVNGNGVTTSSGAHGHTTQGRDPSVGGGTGADAGLTYYADGLNAVFGAIHTTNSEHTHPLNARNADSSHQNMQPYQIVNWVIKT